IVLCSCPQGFDLVRNGECRGKYESIISFDNETAMVAVDKCKEINGYPVIIHDAEDYKYWMYLNKGGSQYATVLGLVCDTNSKKWIWADGSAVDFKPPQDQDYMGYNIQLDDECTLGCSFVMYGAGLGFWLKYCTTPRNYGYDVYCQTQLQQPVAGGCAEFENDVEDGACYEVYDAAAANWQEAQATCHKFGAELASIHSFKENNFVRRLALSKGANNGVFLGATVPGKGRNYEWTDGSNWDYDNFYPGFPNTKFGECIAMDTSSPTGQWMNINCTAKLSVACTRKQGFVAQPTCTDKTWKEGETITSPGFPFTANTPCDYVLTVPQGKKVSVEIDLEANSCCDNLILYDGPTVTGWGVDSNWISKLTGQLRNATYATSSSNSMRVSWQPNGGVNVRGFQMTFRAV
ncbi:hypothetical protein PENTCL1PPCAC_4000, partial [Pristionchus entomophagus]